jgi:hypothetical protein
MSATAFSDFESSDATSDEDVKRTLSFISISKLWKKSFAK